MNRQLNVKTPDMGFMKALMLAGAVGVAVSLAYVLTSLGQEHHAAFDTSSDGVVWGLPVATYIFFALASTGIMFVGSLAMVFGIHKYYPIAKRCVWLAMVTLVAGFTALAFELGHPFRMLWAVPASFQAKSPLVWMGVFYASCMVLLVLKFRLLASADWASPASRRLGTASLVLEVLAASTLGLAFGMIAARPVWFGGSLPVYFLLTGLLTGVALTVLATYAAYGFARRDMPEPLQSLMSGSMPRLFAVALGLSIVALAARTITGLWSNQEGFQAFDQIVGSPLFHLELWVGMVLPFALLLSPATREAAGTHVASAALVLVAVFIGRYEFVVGGQVVPVFKGAWMGEFAQYTPSMTEALLTVLSVSLVVALYAAGERYLGLDAAPESVEEAEDEAAAAIAAAARDVEVRRVRAGTAPVGAE